MKNLFFAFFFILIFSSLESVGQKYYLNNGFANGGTVTTCAGKFYDSHPSGTYGRNENYTVTFSSGNSGNVIQITLSTLSLGAGDTLFSYDGSSIHAPVIDTFTNSSQNVVSFTPSFSNTSGSITFKFVSDNSGEKDGWEGDIKCIYPCKQRITGTTKSLPLKDGDGYTNICFGAPATFSVNTKFPDNNSIYHQADSTSIFHWFFGDGTDSSGKNLTSVEHIYTTAGGYYARLKITDSNGCSNSLPFSIPVRNSIKPTFNIPQSASICLLDTAIIRPAATINGQASVIPPTGSFVTLPVSGDSVFLPDEPPACFTSSIVIEQFAPNQTLKNIDDLQGIFMNMEHSYLGDFTISIEAPNGAKVFLKTTVEGSANDGTFLGEPVDESFAGEPTDPKLVGIRGKGYEYFFNTSPKYGTMWDEVSKYTYSYTDNGGQVVTNHYYLPAGSYKSEEDLSALVGTPLNGRWTLEICDKQAIDNGFLFNWKVEFKKSVYPHEETYTVQPAVQTWIPATGLVAPRTTAFITPPTAGTFAYTYRVDDAFGCTYDTTVNLTVKPIPSKPNLGADTTICTGRSVVLQPLNYEAGVSYKWSTNQKDGTDINVSEAGTYWIEATNNIGCKNRDSIKVVHYNPFSVTLGTENLLCSNAPKVLTPKASTPITGWKWSTGATTETYTTATTGTYWVEAKDAGGCLVRDTISVVNNPLNFFDLPNDTTICDKSSYTLVLDPAAGTKILWDDSTTGYSRLINKAATYSLTAEYNGCVHKTAMRVGIRPLPVFSLGKDTTTMCNGFDLPLHVSYPGATFRWSSGTTDSVFVATRSGTYWAEANLNGCTFADTLVMQHKICGCEIKMPNAFSPNGDGINDVYRPTIKCFPTDYHLSIFNRDGQLVFDSKNYSDLWDGKYRGVSLPTATYYYILTYYSEDTKQTEKTNGSITILR